MKGSIPYMAPEVIMRTGYGWPADIWSFGCVMVEMLTARSPWGKFDNLMAAMVRIGTTDQVPPAPAHLSSTCRDFLHLCLQRDAARRPAAAVLLGHDLFRDMQQSPREDPFQAEA